MSTVLTLLRTVVRARGIPSVTLMVFPGVMRYLMPVRA